MGDISRRALLKMLGYSGLGIAAYPINDLFTGRKKMIQRPIPSSGELLPVVGLGTWIQFDVSSSESERRPLRKVLQLMAENGGMVIDSSPMYGNSEEVIGDLTSDMDNRDHFFYATKVWTRGKQAGIDQMNASIKKMQKSTIDLMQVHNLVDWKTHLRTLREWKEEGKIRYIGITHYTVSSHDRLEQIITTEDLDFVQFNYSIRVRNAEKRLLDAARDSGTAVIINEPYEGGSLFRAVRGKELPEWTAEYDISSWGQFFLKYILSHPSVTCVIPGTSDPKHLVDNMGAGMGILPDPPLRDKMVRFIEAL